jgi:hypothetical protein
MVFVSMDFEDQCGVTVIHPVIENVNIFTPLVADIGTLDANPCIVLR